MKSLKKEAIAHSVLTLVKSALSMAVIAMELQLVRPAMAANKPQIGLYNAYFMADELRPNYKWREGWPLRNEQGERVGHTEHFKQGGCFLIYLKNSGNEPVEIERISIDRVRLEHSMREMQTIWYRVEENPIPAGGISEVAIRIREIRAKAVNVTVYLAAGRAITADVPLSSPSVLFDTVACSADGDRLYAYLSTSSLEDAITAVEFDGRAVSDSQMKRYPLTGEILPLRLQFDEHRLAYGSFHTLKVKTASGVEVATRFRVLDDFFSRSTFAYGFGPKTPEDRQRIERDFNLICGELKSWGEGIRYLSGSADDEAGIIEFMRSKENHIHYLSPDEPDAHDFGRTDIEDFQMRVGANAQAVVERSLLRHKHDKSHPAGMVIDATFKPSNYYIYARIPDVLIPDPYSTPCGEPPSWVYNVVELCQLSARPAQVWAILYCTKAINAPFAYYRYPSEAEIRMETYYALGRGVKGISYWWYGSAEGYYGLVDNPELWDEISRLMTEVRIAEKFLASATFVPENIAYTPTGRVRLLPLLNLDQGCAVAVINDDFLMTAEKFETNPVKDVQVAVDFPEWQKLDSVYLLDGGTAKPIAHTRKGGTVRIKLGEVSSASMLILATSEGRRYIEGNLMKERAGK